MASFGESKLSNDTDVTTGWRCAQHRHQLTAILYFVPLFGNSTNEFLPDPRSEPLIFVVWNND